MDVCCWNLNIWNTEIKPYYNWQVLQDWEGNLVRCVKKPRGECKVNIYKSSVIGMIELIEMKQKGQLEWLDDLDALNQLKQPLRFADVWLEKCKFKHWEVDYLGLIISKDHVVMDPVKVQGVTDWPQPVKVKDIQSFIGFMNFYWRFICNFSEIAHHGLTHKSKDWSWGAAKQQAFNALKSAVTSTPMLAFPSKSSPFHLECDASNFATGAVLSQQQEDGLFHLIGFMSKSFSDTEWNYQIHDKEMLAIMQALEEWRHFLKGSDQKFKIHTDHKNLSYF